MYVDVVNGWMGEESVLVKTTTTSALARYRCIQISTSSSSSGKSFF